MIRDWSRPLLSRYSLVFFFREQWTRDIYRLQQISYRNWSRPFAGLIIRDAARCTQGQIGANEPMKRTR